MTSKNPGCATIPDIQEKTKSIKDTLEAMGAKQECKELVEGSSKEASEAFEAAAEAHAGVSGGFVSANVGASASTASSKGSSELANKMTKSGCGDVYANVNQQLAAKQDILCQLTNNKNIASTSINQSNTVQIVQLKLDPVAEAAHAKVATDLFKPAVKPTMPELDFASVAKLPPKFQEQALDLLSEQQANYPMALKAYNIQNELNVKVMDDITGKVTIANSSFTLKSGIEVHTLQNSDNISTTKMEESYKKIAEAAASQELKKQTGVGGDATNQIKSMIANQINDKSQSIAQSIKNSINSVKMTGGQKLGFTLNFYGPLDYKNVKFDGFVQARIVTENISKNAEGVGKSLASDIVTKTTSSNKSETSSKGMESLMAEIQKGRAEQMKAVGDAITDVTKAQAEAMGGGMNQLLPIIGAMMLFGGGAGGGGGMMSKILMFVGIALIAYFALAYFMGFWPFNKSDEPEKKMYAPHMPMAMVASLGGPYKGIQPLKLGHKFKSASPYSKGASLKI